MPDGCGLGLPLVKRLVDFHGGMIAFTSEKEKGNILTITLPNEEITRNRNKGSG